MGSDDDGAETRTADPLGVDAATEELYRALLVRPGSTLADLREATGFGPKRLRRLLDVLERQAMVTRRGGHPARFQPTPPDIVIDALASAREHELDQARLAAHQLTALLQTPAEQLHVTELVEILTSPTAVAERWTQLQTATRTTLDVFDRPPYAQTASEEHEPLQSELRRRGVVTRGIYDEDALSYPGTIDHLRHVTMPDEVGVQQEQARVVSRLPIKMALFDRRTALVPLTGPIEGDAIDAGVVVHRSALLDALLDLFNTYWHRGTDVVIEDGQVATSGTRTDDSTILTMLAGGLKDDAIARALGVSTHTVRRRVSDIKQRIGATTRFQAGLALGRQGAMTLDGDGLGDRASLS
ncbi:MAG: LuxR C-terminal-related transcriptional regulator [Nocardioidaceae bacterium]